MIETRRPVRVPAGARRARLSICSAKGATTISARALGAHVAEMEGVRGVRFAVWAPNARRVSVVGDFNGWDGRRHPMRLRHGAGVWELFIPRLGAGRALQIRNRSAPDGELLPLKADPVAVGRRSRRRPPPRSSPSPAPHRWQRRRLDGASARRQIAPRCADLDLRGARLLLAARGGRRRARLGRLAERLVPYVARHRLHPCRAAAGDGASVRRQSGATSRSASSRPVARLGPPAISPRFVDRCHRGRASA